RCISGANRHRASAVGFADNHAVGCSGGYVDCVELGARAADFHVVNEHTLAGSCGDRRIARGDDLATVDGDETTARATRTVGCERHVVERNDRVVAIALYVDGITSARSSGGEVVKDVRTTSVFFHRDSMPVGTVDHQIAKGSRVTVFVGICSGAHHET